MDINAISTLISSLGFPIVMCGALFWKMNKQDENHKQEIETLRQSLDNNTKILSEISGRLINNE